MKKICFITTIPITAEVFLKTPINELSKYYEVHLASNFLINKKMSFNIKCHHIPIDRKINIKSDILCLLKIINILKNEKFDIIHTITPKAGLLGLISGLLSKTPIRIHTFTGQVWANKKGIFRLILKNIDRLINALATNVIVDGYSQRVFLIENKIINQKSIVFGKGSICGVDTEKFKPNKLLKAELRFQYNIKDHEYVFMFMGRLNHEKGVLDLLKAFNNIKTNYLQKLVIVGPDEENIIANKLFDQKKIIHIPFTKTPEKILQICDVFCLPSYREGFGLSVIEASSTQKPVICSDIYGLKDTIKDNVTGIRHNKGNINDLTTKLVFALENKDILTSMGIEGRKYVINNFSKKFILNEWVKYYKKLN